MDIRILSSVTMYQKRITNWMRCPPWSNYKDVGGSPVGSYECRGWDKLGGNSSSKLVEDGERMGLGISLLQTRSLLIGLGVMQVSYTTPL